VFLVDPSTGQSKDPDVKKLWSREYEKGWEVKV
jgi:methylglyoxal synthase